MGDRVADVHPTQLIFKINGQGSLFADKRKAVWIDRPEVPLRHRQRMSGYEQRWLFVDVEINDYDEGQAIEKLKNRALEVGDRAILRVIPSS